MRFLVLRVCLIGFCTLMSFVRVQAQAKDRCLDKETQSEMNVCEAERYHRADAELNLVYQELLKKRSADKVFVQKLKLAEEAWIKFRDANIEALYPEEDKALAYGSVYPMCRAMQLSSMTDQRTEFLRRMLKSTEGDVCGFSSAALSAPREENGTELGQSSPKATRSSHPRRTPLLRT